MDDNTSPAVGNAGASGLAEGQRLRDRGLSVAERRRRRLARRWARRVVELALAGQRVTADDAHDELRLSDDIRHKWIGAVFRFLSVARVIKRAGAVPSRRPENHARLQSIWALADRSVAERWLADHPELPAPAVPSLLDGLDDGSAVAR